MPEWREETGWRVRIDMRVSRHLVFWGLGFVTAGVVALAIQQGYLDRGAMANAWRLWPLILVALGISLIAARTQWAVLGSVIAALVIGAVVGTALAVGPGIAVSCSSDSPVDWKLDSHTGTFGASATLDWQLNCGELTVNAASGSGWSAGVGITRGSAATVSSGSDRLEITSADQDAGFLVDRGRERWEVTLPTAPAYAADIRTNAAKATLDLSGMRFSSFAMQPNAADVHLIVNGARLDGVDLEVNAGSAIIDGDAATVLEGQIQVNAGSVKLCVPANAAVRITATGTAFGTNVNGGGFTHSGDTWESGTYALASSRITLTVHGNAASFDLNPSGGCQ